MCTYVYIYVYYMSICIYIYGGGGGLVTKLCPTLAIPWTVACQAPLSMGFSRQEYWSGLPFPSPWDFLDLRTEPRSPAWQADSLPSEPAGKLKFPNAFHLSILHSNLPVFTGIFSDY